MLCRLLIVLTAWTPFSLQAGMIGTGQAVSHSVPADRAAVLAFVQRDEVARQLQSLGIDPAAARERVYAMTDEEFGALGNNLDSLPAGGWSRSANVVVFFVVVIAFVYWWNVRHPAK
jgi:hypothetical protein